MDPAPPPPPPPPPPPADIAAAEEVQFEGLDECSPAPPASEPTAVIEEGFEAFGEAPPPPPPAAPAKASARLVLIPLCRKGDRVGIEHAITNGGASVEEIDIEGNTPLHVAVEAPRNEIATVQSLLEHMANPNAVNYIGAAPLHYVCLRKTNWRGIANILLENGANIDCQTLAGKTALHFACENQLPELVEVLCLFGADTNLLDSEANTAMHLALAKEGGRDTVKKQIIEHLLTSSANFLCPNLRGISPIHLASTGGYMKCAQYLSEVRADMCAMTSKGETALHMACRAGHSEMTQLFIQGAPHIMNAQDHEGNTPLHAASYGGNLECAVQLVRAGADAGLTNNRKLSAYDVSKVRGKDLSSCHNPELVQLLKEAKKDKDCRQS